MNNTSRGIIGVCIITLLGLGGFAFTQFNTLTDTQNSLVESEAIGTTVADSLNTANDNINELTTNLDSANAEITEVSTNLDTANAEITQIVESANATATQNADTIATVEAQVGDLGISLNALSTQNVNVIATATQQSIQSVDVLATANAEITQAVDSAFADATQSADILATANAEITQAVDTANATATQYSIEIANMESTISVLNMEATNSANMIATQTSDLATAQATIDPPQDSTEDTSTSDDETSEIELASLKEGFLLFEASDFNLYVPDDFIIYDLRTNQDEAIDAFSKLGFAYDGMALIAGVGDLYIVVGARDTVNADGTLDNLIVTREVLPFSMDMEEYLDIAVEFFPPQLEIIEQSVITLNGEEIGFLQTEIEDSFTLGQQLIYVYNVDDVIYAFAYTTNNLADNRAEFEASLRSFISDN